MLGVLILSIVMLSVIKAERRYAECNFFLIVGNFIGLLSVVMLSVIKAERPYAECNFSRSWETLLVC